MPRRVASVVLAIDIGSSSLRTALFTAAGKRILETTAARQYAIRYTPDGGAELDAAVLLRAAKGCVRETLQNVKAPVIAVSGSAFWHGLLGTDRAGGPVTPILTWADNRSVSDAAVLRSKFDDREIQLRTGCVLRAPFWPAKLLWLRRTEPALFRRVSKWTSPAPWLFAQLFGAPAASHSMASGTGLYNLRDRSWDAELCDYCGVKPAQFDELNDVPIASRPARILRDATVFAAIGDGAASNLGSGADRRGYIAINIGTSAAARTVATRDRKVVQRLPAGLFAYVLDAERLVLGGAVSNAGNLRAWCMRELRLEGAAERALSREHAAADTLTVLPYLVRERAPTWPENVRGIITGMTTVTSAADIFRAATTATYYRLADILDALKTAVSGVEEVIVSGGVLKSPASLHILADCLGRDLRICRELESSLRGAAIHALTHLGPEVAPLAAGRLVRHRPALAAKHRLRRERQAELERQMS